MAMVEKEVKNSFFNYLITFMVVILERLFIFLFWVTVALFYVYTKYPKAPKPIVQAAPIKEYFTVLELIFDFE